MRYTYGRIAVSDQLLTYLMSAYDPRPTYGPPAPQVRHVCDCPYCDVEFE